MKVLASRHGSLVARGILRPSPGPLASPWSQAVNGPIANVVIARRSFSMQSPCMPGHFLVASVADVVSSCPPMFQASHRGCQFAPSLMETVVACGMVVLAVALAVAVAVGRKKDNGA